MEWEKDLRRYFRKKSSFVEVGTYVMTGLQSWKSETGTKSNIGTLLKPWTKYMEHGPEPRGYKIREQKESLQNVQI